MARARLASGAAGLVRAILYLNLVAAAIISVLAPTPLGVHLAPEIALVVGLVALATLLLNPQSPLTRIARKLQEAHT